MEQIRCENPNIKQRKKEKTKTEKQTGSPWVENPSPRVSIDQIRCENPNIKQRKKKAEKQTSSPRVENPSPRVDKVKSDAKTLTSNKEKKGKKKNREANFSSPILDSM